MAVFKSSLKKCFCNYKIEHCSSFKGHWEAPRRTLGVTAAKQKLEL